MLNFEAMRTYSTYLTEIGATVIFLQNLRECTIGGKRKGVQEPVRCRYGTRMKDPCTDLIRSIVSNACI